MLPPLILIPFITMYNHHIGIYGVHRKIDSVLNDLATVKDNDSKVKKQVIEF